MYETKALAYVIARGPDVFAIIINVQASDGVALPVAAMAAVATMVPVVVAMTKQTVNVASTIATYTFPDGNQLGCPHAGPSRVQAKVFD